MELKHVLFEAEDLSIIEQVFRTSLLYFLLFASDKAMGFKQNAITTPYNFIMAAGISHISATRIVVPDSRPIDAFAIIIVYTIFMLCFTYFGYLKLPSIVSQTPTIIVKNGKIIKKNLKKTRLTLDNVLSILRVKDAFNLEKVKFLVAETTGDFSVAIDSKDQPVTKSSVGIPTTPNELSQLVIYEGRVDQRVLKKNNLDHDWLNQQLQILNIQAINDVFVGILTPEKTLYINRQEV
ncbi:MULTISPECIES: DUF421 domain-containing protein [Fictibacillus]|jgi:uncharacterized membrane protein YcaP (DUF421 family)|uniref:DUF421 domain-containing protein n=1 Tax=Fictibacillus TaxID=1329200 RepID=UPI0018CF81BB|nr:MULTISPECIES: DUF421 domain-containing protein [unclassified Fictibacillus]MBH0156455.1 DUF421 domain-containing protein [Fictibacillus sp. 5RED26]MBH0162004.1 DUF421 domain-containing protein [Fictibacillus sp. 26RED30]MBH0175578.1 DUF421 domain-containing protein [Fictibacillus sp. 23RED33]